MSEPVTEGEIQAYVDGRLGSDGRGRVQAYLSRRPDLAAQVMADLRNRDEVRAAFATLDEARPELTTVAGRLQRQLAMRSFVVSASRGVAALMLVGLGWFLNLQVGPPGIEGHAGPALLKVLLHAGEPLVEAELGIGALLVEHLARPG